MQTVVTHSGNFHPDDVLAVATLQLYLGKDEVEVIRSRDQSIIDEADWVVDVGGVYDVKTNRFDHHQKESPARENGTLYAAFGLVWKEYGEKICGSAEIAKFLDNHIVLPIDAGDNGVSIYTLNDKSVEPFELYNVLHSYRPTWGSDETDDECFIKAVDFARGLLERLIASGKASEKMQAVVDECYQASENKEVIISEVSVNTHCLVKYPEPKVLIYKSDSNGDTKWKVQAVPVSYSGFENRSQFPAEWAGLSNGELTEVSGIEGAVFCHKGRFLFACDSKEGALEAAKHVK